MTLIIGHAGRGVRGASPENTRLGVRDAIAAKVDAMEIDVHLCADGMPVVIHDATVDRTTTLHGRVRGLSVAALRAADCGAGQHVPTLSEMLEISGTPALLTEA